MEIIDIFFNLSVLERAFPALLRGVWNTLLLGATAIVVGGIAGVLICLVRLYTPWPTRWATPAYLCLLVSTWRPR